MGHQTLSFASCTLLALLLAGCVIKSETNTDEDKDTSTGGRSSVDGQATGGGSDGSAGADTTQGAGGSSDYNSDYGGAQATDGTAGAAGAMSAEEAACLEAGGTVSVMLCCSGNNDFFDSCVGDGTCTCDPEYSHEVKACVCPEGECFDRHTCVAVEL